MGFRRLFFDIETSYFEGWFWNPSFKTKIGFEQILKPSAIICICYKWQGSDKVHYLKWDKGNDKQMINKFVEVLEEADEIIGHNSDKFDLKWIRTRCLLYGHKSIPQLKSIDTLKISRSQFKFPSNRLNDIGIYLGVGKKVETGGIQLWHDVIQKNSSKAMSKMIEYCKGDVILLEKIFLKLEGYSKPKTHVGVQSNGNKCDCPYCASDKTRLKDRAISASGSVSVRMSCNDCHKYFTVSLKAYNNR